MVVTVPLQVVLMISIPVVMVLASLIIGNVMVGTIVQIQVMKLTALLHLAKIKDYGIVAMDSVFHQIKFVMDQTNFVTLDGVLTVLMAQMKA